MASEFTPPGQGAKMTKAQVRQYIRDMKIKRENAKKKLKELEVSGELEQEKQEVKQLEKKIEKLDPVEKEGDVDTEEWEFFTVDEFFDTYDLYKKILWFTIGAPQIKTIFTETLPTNLERIIDEYYRKQGEITRHILGSTEYPNYVYVEGTSEYIIKIK